MFFDLNVPLPVPALLANYANHNKQKQSDELPCLFSAVQIAALEARIDLLVHLGYNVIALSQVCQSKIDVKTHVNHLSGLVTKLKKRQGIQLLKRLTIVLDEASEKGNGINVQNTSILLPYDILAVRPFTSGTFSAACLTHSVPSQTTSHVISIPISHSARLPYYLKHTLVRTAISNGSVFEIDYAGALSSDESERKFWWGGLREVIRVTKGKGLLLSGGIETDKTARAPRDVANLITIAGLPQNLSHDAVSQTAKTVVLRAQSRKTYRSILSEPTLILPSVTLCSTTANKASDNLVEETTEISKEELTKIASTATSASGNVTDDNQGPQGIAKDHLEINRNESSFVSQMLQQPQSKQKQKQREKDVGPDTSSARKRQRADSGSDQHNKQKIGARTDISSKAAKRKRH